MKRDMRKIAENYARRGWHIFPIQAGTKDQPKVAWGSEATDDVDTVRKWWKKWPDSNIGLATSPSGLAVIDLDVKKGKDGIARLDELELDHGPVPRDLVASTPSGGQHIYTAGTTPSGTDLLAVGVDIKSAGGRAGGYVLAPGSVLTGKEAGEYAWMKGIDPEDPPPPTPVWIRQATGKARDKAAEMPEPIGPEDHAADITWAMEFLTSTEPAVEGSGGDDHTVKTTMKLRDHGLSEGVALGLMLEIFNPRCSPPWDAHDMETKVRNAYAYPSGAQGSESAAGDFDDDDVGEEIEEKKPIYGGIGDQWVWVAGPKWFVNRETSDRLDRESFDSLYSHLIEANKTFSWAVFNGKRQMRRLHRFCYRPNEIELPEDKSYNTWRPAGVEPDEAGAPWLLDHLAYLFPDEEDRGHVLRWLAHVATNPARRTHHALLIQGEEGTGKSFLHELMAKLVGQHNTVRVTTEELKGRYNEWAGGSQLCLIAELMAFGRQDIANKLKPLITDPYARVEEKFRNPYTIENHMNFLILTNHLDAIPISKGDRRYMCVTSPVLKKDIRSKEYFDKLFDRLDRDKEGRGPEEALGELMKVDLSKYNPKAPAPATSGKEIMRRASMHDVEHYLLDCFEHEEPPLATDLVAVKDVKNSLPVPLNRAHRLENTIGSFLKSELGAENLGQHRTKHGRKTLWAIRRQEMLGQLTAAERSRLYDAGGTGDDFDDLEDSADILPGPGASPDR